MKRAGKLAAVFGVYAAAVLGVTYFASFSVEAYVWPAATRWILAGYVVLGALGVLGACLGGLRRADRLDEHLGELQEESRSSVPPAAVPPPRPRAEPEAPSDQDVEDLLTELHQISVGGEAGRRAFEDEAKAPASRETEEVARLRAARLREARRLQSLRDSVAGTLAGPAFASVAVLGVFASLLPAADGFLFTNLQANAWLGLAGVGWLAGILAYGIAAFRGLRPA